MKKIIPLMLLVSPLVLLSCNKSTNIDEWYKDVDYINSLTINDIGLVKEVIVNKQIHKVRLIGINHDELASGSGKAHTTWEFINLISDTRGYSIATVWDWQNGIESTSNDFINSNVRKAIDGGGTAPLAWYEKGMSTRSKKYKKPVIDMLPKGLKVNLKEVKKKVAISKVVTEYNTKLFLFSCSEISNNFGVDEGNVYKFYQDHVYDAKYADRVKYQVKWHDGSSLEAPRITDVDFYAHNYAGWNSNKDDSYGADAWLCSPIDSSGEDQAAHYISVDGYLTCDTASTTTYGVAPGFCL